MNLRKVKAGCLAACLLMCLHSLSQTIDYTTSNLPTTVCNVFNLTPARVISGFTHYPVSGGATFNGKKLILQCQDGTTTSTSLGTAYALAFSFKSGYNYTLSFTAVDTSLDPVSNPRLDLGLLTALPDPNTTHPADCGPVDQGHWGGLVQFLVGGNYLTRSSPAYTLPAFTATGNFSYLLALAWKGSQTAMTSVYLSNITITERPPTFTLSPTTVNKSCGSGLSQTFTITNVYNSGGVTSYQWDLGSAANGWLYNGTAAPQTITTSTPTLTLTSDGCSSPGSVTATAYIGSTGFVAGTATVAVTGVASSINGPDQICSTGDFTINGLPCGSSLTWSVSPAGSASLSTTTGSTTTVTVIGSPVHVILTANLVTSCGSFQVSKLITTASPPTQFGLTGSVPCQPGGVVQVCTFTVVPSTHDLTYHWSYAPSGGSIVNIPGTGSSISKKFGVGSYTIYCWGSNACGETDEASYEFNVLRCSSPNVAMATPGVVQVSPNPASDVVTVSAVVREIRIIDKTGRVLRRQQFPAGTKLATIHVEDLKPDVYILQIGDGKTFTSQKLSIQR